jgi:hypothetical protein
VPRASVTTRLNADELAHVDQLAADRGTNRSEVLRLLAQRELVPPGRMQLEEALDLLDAKARAGNTQAIIKISDRLLSERRDGTSDHDLRAYFGLQAVE